MRKQPKRAALIAQRNVTFLRKRQKLRSAVSSADNSAARNNLRDNREVICLNRGNDALKPKDSMVSSLTPSSSTLDLHSLESESFFSFEDDEQATVLLDEQPLVTDFQNRDILQTMSELKVDFKDANRDKDDSLLPRFLQDIKSMVFETTYASDEEKQIVEHLDKATDYLWKGADVCKAEIQYQVRF